MKSEKCERESPRFLEIPLRFTVHEYRELVACSPLPFVSRIYLPTYPINSLMGYNRLDILSVKAPTVSTIDGFKSKKGDLEARA